MLTLPDPIAGAFGNGRNETVGASKVIGTFAVPNRLVTIAASDLCFASPR